MPINYYTMAKKKKGSSYVSDDVISFFQSISQTFYVFDSALGNIDMMVEKDMPKQMLRASIDIHRMFVAEMKASFERAVSAALKTK